jgi:alkylhydroperoxidase family enzyme
VTRLQDGEGAPSDFDAVFGRRPKYSEAFFASFSQVASLVDPVLFELGRLRSAQLIGSTFDLSLRFEPALAAGLTEEKIAAIRDYPTSPLFSKEERAWIEYVEQFTIQSSAIDDEMCSRLIQQLGEEQFALHTRAHWAAESVQRACAVLDIQAGPSAPDQMKGFILAEAA